jgi:hypothetical protein
MVVSCSSTVTGMGRKETDEFAIQFNDLSVRQRFFEPQECENGGNKAPTPSKLQTTPNTQHNITKLIETLRMGWDHYIS